MHAHRFGIMNFEETIVGKLTEVYQTVHLKEFTDFPKKDEKDPTTVFTDIHFEKKSIAHEAYHLSPQRPPPYHLGHIYGSRPDFGCSEAPQGLVS